MVPDRTGTDGRLGPQRLPGGGGVRGFKVHLPSGVYLGFVLAPGPGAPNGSAFDFASGPIIPNSVFPVLVRGDVFLNGALFEGLNAKASFRQSPE
jgi:hypothetical protein